MQNVIEVELLDLLHGATALLQDPAGLINLKRILLSLLHAQCLVVDIAGLLLVAPLLRLALILPLVDDDALNVLCIDQGLQEPLAVADGDEPLECLRLPQPLDRFQ